MRIFRSECYAYKQNKKKLDSRCTKGIFLGYNKGSPAYLVYIPETGKIMKYRVVKFPRRGVEQQTQTEGLLSHDDFMPSQHNTNPEICGESDVDKSGKGPDELAEGPKAENETSPTFQPHDESVRHSKRERKLPSYLTDYVTDMEDSDQVLTSTDYFYKFLLSLKLTKRLCNRPSLEIGKQQ